MSYHALGAGPGETRTYFIDVPPMEVLGVDVWGGPNTEITLPTQALVGDVVGYARWYVPALVDDAVARLKQHMPAIVDEAVARAAPELLGILEAEIPRLWKEDVQPMVRVEERRLIKVLYITTGLLLAGMVGAAWWKYRKGRI